eukprot:tig00021357_g20754.t1
MPLVLPGWASALPVHDPFGSHSCRCSMERATFVAPSQAFSLTRPSAPRHSHWEARQSTLAERGLEPLESTREGSRFRAFPELPTGPGPAGPAGTPTAQERRRDAAHDTRAA